MVELGHGGVVLADLWVRVVALRVIHEGGGEHPHDHRAVPGDDQHLRKGTTHPDSGISEF